MLTFWIACTVSDPPLESSPPDSPVMNTPVVAVPERPRRVLVVMADDLGVDVTRAYAGEGAPMPTVEAICDAGIRFEDAWANHLCSPTRAAMMTGQYAFRTGVGAVVDEDHLGLTGDQVLLPRWLESQVELRHASFGKWHIGTREETGGDKTPTETGWQAWSGFLSGALTDYYSWARTEDGISAIDERYHTTATVDDAITWLDSVEDDESWLLWVAFAAPHTPFHEPPEDLHSYPLDDTEHLFEASIEAMDTELARLLADLEQRGFDDVDIVFLADNGTDVSAVPEDLDADRSKGTLYQGGLHVPMCIAGPSVTAPGVSSERVHAIDVFATVGELMGADLSSSPGIDSVSIVPVLRGEPFGRDWSFSEGFDTRLDLGEGQAIRDDRFKVIRFASNRTEIYDLTADGQELEPLDTNALTEDEQAAIQRLEELLDGLTD